MAVSLLRGRKHYKPAFLHMSISCWAIPNSGGLMKPKPKHCREMFAALSDYMDGLINDGVCAKMGKHLRRCQPCEAFLASLENVVKQCRSYNPPSTPAV